MADYRCSKCETILTAENAAKSFICHNCYGENIENTQQGDKLQQLNNEEVTRTFIVMELEDIERPNAINARLYDIDKKTEQWMMVLNHYNIRWKVVERLTPC